MHSDSGKQLDSEMDERGILHPYLAEHNSAMDLPS